MKVLWNLTQPLLLPIHVIPYKNWHFGWKTIVLVFFFFFNVIVDVDFLTYYLEMLLVANNYCMSMIDNIILVHIIVWIIFLSYVKSFHYLNFHNCVSYHCLKIIVENLISFKDCIHSRELNKTDCSLLVIIIINLHM